MSQRGDLPQGLLMALSKDIDSIKRFFELSEEEQTVIVQKARTIHSRIEMELLVRSI